MSESHSHIRIVIPYEILILLGLFSVALELSITRAFVAILYQQTSSPSSGWLPHGPAFAPVLQDFEATQATVQMIRVLFSVRANAEVVEDEYRRTCGSRSKGGYPWSGRTFVSINTDRAIGSGVQCSQRLPKTWHIAPTKETLNIRRA
jgi:hypothetical protein